MCFVDDQRVVAAQHAVALNLGEQDAIGHHLYQRLLADRVGEPNCVTNGGAQVGAQLLGHSLGDRARRHSTRLRVTDQPVDTATQVETQLGQLGAFPGACFASDDDHLMVPDSRHQIGATGGQGQRVWTRKGTASA